MKKKLGRIMTKVDRYQLRAARQSIEHALGGLCGDNVAAGAALGRAQVLLGQLSERLAPAEPPMPLKSRK